MPDTAWMARNQRLYWQKPRVELNITHLKKIHIMIPSNILLYSLISALSSSHLRGVLKLQIGASAETHSQTVYEERV